MDSLLKLKKETRAAVKIQSQWRSYKTRQEFIKTKKNMIKLQALCRGYIARRNRELIVYNIKAVKIQACVRGWLARCRYKKVIRGIVLLQSHFRRRKARKFFKDLKIEARSVEHQRQLNKGLENKIISLQQQIERINKERDALMTKAAELEPLKAQVSNLKHTAQLVKEYGIKIHEQTDELSTLKENYEKMKLERDSLAKAKDQLEKSAREAAQKSTIEVAALRAELAKSADKSKELQATIEEMKNQLVELENERANHQKLIKENGRLEQRFDKVRNELVKLSKPTQSQSQNLELESLIEELENDTKFATTSSSAVSQANGLASSDDTEASSKATQLVVTYNSGGDVAELDLSLLGKLQRRIAQLELERKSAAHRLVMGSAAAESDNNNNQDICDQVLSSDLAGVEKLQQERDFEMIKSQELDFENQKLREDLSRLRDLIADNQAGKSESIINKEMMNQYDALNEEVQRRREECVQLKTLLITKYRMGGGLAPKSSVAGSEFLVGGEAGDTNADISSINTDGNEYEVGFNTQKILNRMLENQITDLTKRHDSEREMLLKDIKSLRDETGRQQDLLLKNLPPEILAEATYKSEIVKLADQNLELSEKCDKYSEEIKRYKKMLKIYIKRNRTTNVHDRMGLLNSSSVTSMNGGAGSSGPLNSTAYLDADKTLSGYMMSQHGAAASLTLMNNTLNVSGGGAVINQSHGVVRNNTLSNANQLASGVFTPQIRIKHTGDYLGYLEWKVEDESLIIRRLIDDLKPRLAATFLPGLPAYILFMCIRYADIINDDERVRSLLNAAFSSIKKIVKKKMEDLEYWVLWMTNSCRLIHNLKQYSGEPAFQFQNTSKQNDHCLKNFDLAEYRGILSDVAIWLFQGIIKDFEKKLGPIIVKAMLEHVSLPSILDTGGASGRPSGMRSSGSPPTENGKHLENYTIESLIKKLNEFLNILKSHGLDPEIVNQIFKQLFFFIGATTFNNLLLRKDMCNWSKGIELRFNISLLEQFVRDSRLQDSGAVEALDPIIQTCQLLQSRKTDADIKSICEMCSKLTIAQIQRILFLYTPLDSYEEKLTRTFIDKVTANLKELRKMASNTEQQVLIIDTKRQFPISIPFNPSSIGLESIEIPDQLDLNFLKKI